MYITINDIIGEKRIYLFYPIKGREIAVVSMLSDNVQYWLQGSIEVLLKTGKKIVLKEYCHAAHSQTQNKSFLSDENQHPIFI